MRDIYVSNAPLSKSDNQTGEREAPYSSIYRALEESRNCEKPCRIILLDGTYFVQNPIELTQKDSGLTICAEGKAVISGAKPLGKLDFEKYSENIWCAKVDCGEFDRLYADDILQTRCRFPNRQEGVVPLEGAASPQEIKVRSRNYQNPQTGFLRAIHVAEWGGNSYIIEGKDEKSPCGLKLKWVGDNNRGSKYGNAMVVENVFEELDAPKEWFYDEENALLYWYPPKCVNPNDCFISVSKSTELLTIKGDENAPVKDITIENITFSRTSQTIFPKNESDKKYMPLLRGDWCVVPSGAVYIENAENCTIRSCSFLNAGGNAMFMYGYNCGHTITNNEFSNINACAIQVVGKQKCVRQPSYWENEQYPDLPVHQKFVEAPDSIGPCAECYPRDVIISENHIDGVGLLEKQSSGVNISVASRIKILHNTIHNSSRSLINVNDGTFGGHEIAWNNMFDSQRETADHGPFNSWGRDRFWSVPAYNASGRYGKKLRNYIKDGKKYDITKIDAYQTTHIHHNRFHHNSEVHSWGIDLDDGSTNYEIDNNLILGIGIKLREGFDRHVHHNLIVDGQLNIHVPYQQSRDFIHDNLIMHVAPVATAGCSAGRFAKSETVMKDNYVFAGGKDVNCPRFIPKFKKLNIAFDKNEVLSNLPSPWNEFFDRSYGKTGCIAEKEEYVPDFGKSEEVVQIRLSGAQCTNVTSAVRSSTALSDNDGLYVKKVFPFSKAARLGIKPRDVIRTIAGQKARLEKQTLTAPVTIWRENKLVELKKK